MYPNQDKPRNPHGIHPLFTGYLGELSPDKPVWRDGDVIRTAAEVLEELERSSSTGIRYARAVLHEMYKLVRRPLRKQVPAPQALDVTAKARDMFAPIFKGLKPKDIVWKTMSGTTTAAQMIALIQADHEDAIQFINGRMYLARDLLVAEARN